MAKFDIFGVSGDMVTNMKNVFDIDESCSNCFVGFTKKTYYHDVEGDTNFHYKYMVEVHIFGDKVCYELKVMPMPQDLNKELYDCVCDGLNKNASPTIADVSYNISGILMVYFIENGDKIDFNKLDEIANTVDFIDDFRGFYFDRYQNKIGENGWDFIDKYIKGKDKFKTSTVQK